MIVVQQLKRGKITGYDNSSPEHIIHSHSSLIWHLYTLFNTMLKHCYEPKSFGSAIVIPLVKDKRGDVHYSTSPVLSKVF